MSLIFETCSRTGIEIYFSLKNWSSVGLVLNFEHTRQVGVLGQKTENAYQGYQYSQSLRIVYNGMNIKVYKIYQRGIKYEYEY